MVSPMGNGCFARFVLRLTIKPPFFIALNASLPKKEE